jgi:GYF domain 2
MEEPMPSQWFYSQDGRTMHGPCTSVEMKQLASTGQILPDYRVQRKGREKTVMARNVKGLFLPAAE